MAVHTTRHSRRLVVDCPCAQNFQVPMFVLGSGTYLKLQGQNHLASRRGVPEMGNDLLGAFYQSFPTGLSTTSGVSLIN